MKIPVTIGMTKKDKEYILSLQNRSEFISMAINGSYTELEQMNKIEFIGFVEKKMKKKTKQQLGFYFGGIISKIKLRLDQDGNIFTEKQISDFLCSKFNLEQLIDIETGEISVFPRSVADTDVIQMINLIDNSIEYARNTFGLVIQSPEEYKQLKNKHNEK